MKLAALLFAILSILFLSCNELDIHDDQYINDPENPIIKGKLRSKAEMLQNNNAYVEYYYNNLGYLTKEVLLENEKPIQTQIYERNSDGLKIREYSFTGNTAPSEVWTFTSYEYDRALLKRKIYTKDRKINWQINYEYDDDLLTTSTKYDGDKISEKHTYEYDTEKRVIKILGKDAEGTTTGIITYEYQQDTTIKFVINEDGTIKGVPYQTVYDSYGNIIEEAYLYLPPTGRRLTNQFIYNNQQQLIESRHYDAGVPTSVGPLSIFKYFYF